MNKLEGIYTALVTPIYPLGNINYDVLDYLIEEQISNLVSGIVFGGTTGEGMLIDNIEMYYQHSIKIVEERTKVILTLTKVKKFEIEKQIEFLNRLNYDYLLVPTPAYLTTSQDGVYKYYEYISMLSNKPIIIYYNPTRSNQYITEACFKKLFLLDNVIGIKDASSSMITYKEIMQVINNKSYLLGNDDLYLKGLLLGINGIISTITNVFPSLMLEIKEYMSYGEVEKAKILFNKFMILFNVLKEEPSPIGLKYLLSCKGYNVGDPMFPLVRVSDVTKERINKAYSEVLK